MAIATQLCRISARTVVSLPENYGRIGASAGRKRISVIRCSAGESPAFSSTVSTASSDQEFDAKVFRHNLTRSKNYNRRGFGLKEETQKLMNREYTSKSFPSGGGLDLFAGMASPSDPRRHSSTSEFLNAETCLKTQPEKLQSDRRLPTSIDLECTDEMYNGKQV